jgi:hypothetical protein
MNMFRDGICKRLKPCNVRWLRSERICWDFWNVDDYVAAHGGYAQSMSTSHCKGESSKRMVVTLRACQF